MTCHASSRRFSTFGRISYLAAAKTGHDKTAIQRQIDATDREIDRLVYELYALTEDEIKIVEEGTG